MDISYIASFYFTAVFFVSLYLKVGAFGWSLRTACLNKILTSGFVVVVLLLIFERERERERHQLVASHLYPDWNCTLNLGMCSDCGSILSLLVYGTTLQSAEPPARAEP